MQSVEQKIRKLLSITSDPAASQAERENALAHASRLAARHAIDLSSVGAEAKDWGVTTVHEFVSQQWNRTPRLPQWAPFVESVVQEFFFVKLLQCEGRRQSGVGDSLMERTRLLSYLRIDAFGSLCDRRVAAYVFTFLRREFLRLARARFGEYRKSVSAQAERNFYFGVAAGLADALRDVRGSSVSAADSSALIQTNVALQDAFNETFPGTEKCKSPSAECSMAGYEMGQKIRIATALPASEVPRLDVARPV